MPHTLSSVPLCVCRTAGGSLLTTLGIFLNSLKMCCLHYRHLSGDVGSWLDRAKENNGGRYSETHVENVKVLAKLFPLYGLQLLYRACITQVGHWEYWGSLIRSIKMYHDGFSTRREAEVMFFPQIPSGYYIQTMNSKLHLNNLLLPIGAMNVISILPLLLLAPLIECVTTCYLSKEKTPPAPAKVISEYPCVHARPRTNARIILTCLSLFPLRNYSAAPSHHPSLSILPFQLWATRVPPCRSWWQVCLSCRGRRTLWWSRRCLEEFCRCPPCHVSGWLLSTSCWVSQRLSSLPHVCDRIMVLQNYVVHPCKETSQKIHSRQLFCFLFLSGRFPHIFPADPEPHQRDLPALPHSVLWRRLLSGSLHRSAGVPSFWR